MVRISAVTLASVSEVCRKFSDFFQPDGGRRWRSWLRYWTTSRKIAGYSCFTMAVGSTQPIIEMSTWNITWGVKTPVRWADNLTVFMCLGALTSWNPKGLSRPVGLLGLLYL
jgi:hypothetical protein